jgi:hypothetical protein
MMKTKTMTDRFFAPRIVLPRTISERAHSFSATSQVVILHKIERETDSAECAVINDPSACKAIVWWKTRRVRLKWEEKWHLQLETLFEISICAKKSTCPREEYLNQMTSAVLTFFVLKKCDSKHFIEVSLDYSFEIQIRELLTLYIVTER